MRPVKFFVSLVIGVFVVTAYAQAETRIDDPIAHAHQLLDVLEKNGAKALVTNLATDLGNEDTDDDLRRSLTLVENRKAKFRAVALDRNYGGAIRQIIVYQNMPFEQFPFIYFRFTYKMTDDGWRMTNFRFDAEHSRAFPTKYNID